ncbi:hypothetical protein AEA42_12235 [Shewanella sp. Sh95]|nr:hypothetical protein [Shewanella sp. Sh95]KPN76762.1 hypothetical protein AEA42_12235 [Shewanella sp. Sh95]
MAKQGLVLAFSLGTTVMAGMVQGAPIDTEATAPIELRAAGSLKAAMNDIIAAYQAKSQANVAAQY